MTEEKKKEINKDHQEFLADYEYTCADARGSVGFAYTEQLRSLLRRRVIEMRKAETSGESFEQLKIIGDKYLAMANEVFQTVFSVLFGVRTEFFRGYESEMVSAIGTSFGAFIVEEETAKKIWDSLKDFYEDYNKRETPLRIIKYRGCYFPELDHPYGLASGIVAPKSMRKISEFFGIADKIKGAVPEEYNDLDSLFDWDYEITKAIDVYWLFNVKDNSYESDMKLKACFDYSTHPWFAPETWYKGLKISKYTEADIKDGRDALR